MFPILYESITAGNVPQHNGIGVLSDAISCRVEQERNGAYQLTMEYPMSGIHAEDLALRRIIKAKPNPTDNPQLFRIDRIGKVMNGVFSCYAKHISYDLSGYEISSGSANSASSACLLLQNATDGYTIVTDKTTSGNFEITEPSSVRSWFGGKTGSFLDVFGTAEIKYDNFVIQFLLNAGEDRNVTIRYGKNLLELSQEIGDTVYTHVVCFYKNEDTMVIGSKISTGLSLDAEKTLILDLSGDYEEVPTQAQLTAKAQAYINSNNLTTPSNNIKLDFVQSEELSGRVDLCDTVTIYYEALGISRTQVKCIRTVYDCIREKYVETEFGDPKTNLADSMVQASKAIEEKPSKSYMAEAVDRATKLITGNLGGHLILHDSNGDGEPDELLIMDTDDISTAVNVWRFNQAGWGHSSDGYDGNYTLAATLDGGMVANFITAGSMSANRVRAGMLVSENGFLIIDLDNGTITAPSITLNGEDVESTLDSLVQTSVVTRYALSNSGTVIPDTFGLTDPTTPTEQQPYLWARTIYTYANGQTNTSYSVSARGANGADGADGAGLNILGNYDTMADLIADHPTGSAGQAYMVGTDLVVWNTQTNSWQNVGRIQGANGSDGFWLTIENDDDGTLANITYTARMMRGYSDVTSSYDSVFAWYLIKESGITLIAEDTSTITISRDSADYGATIRCIVIAVIEEEDLEDYSYTAITDYSGNIIQVIGTNNIKLIGESNIYKPDAISAQFQVLSDEISSKVSQTTFNSLSNTVTSQGTAIEQNAQQITLKADTSTVNTQMNGKMATDMSNRSSAITINSGKIQFDSDSIVINSTNLQVTQNGLVTAKNFKAKESFSLVDSNGISRGNLDYNSVGGTSFREYTQSNKLVAVISAADGDGGQLRLYDKNGNQRINGNGQTGSLYTYSENGTNQVSLTSASNGGSLLLKNPSGNNIAGLYGSSGGSGYLAIFNSSNGQTIHGHGDTGNLTCVSLTQTSSRKVKENIKPIEDAEKILELDAVSFDYKDKARGTDKRGFIAEDVAKVLPNLVTEETKDFPATLDYIGMIPYLQAVIKAQDQRIQALEEKLNDIMKEKEK